MRPPLHDFVPRIPGRRQVPAELTTVRAFSFLNSWHAALQMVNAAAQLARVKEHVDTLAACSSGGVQDSEVNQVDSVAAGIGNPVYERPTGSYAEPSHPLEVYPP